MDKQRVAASLSVTIALAMGLSIDVALAAKPTAPGGGGTANQCAGVNTWGIYVADDEAKCEKLIGRSPASRAVDFWYDSTAATGMLVHLAGTTGYNDKVGEINHTNRVEAAT